MTASIDLLDLTLAAPPFSGDLAVVLPDTGDTFTERARSLVFLEQSRGVTFEEPGRFLVFNSRKGTMPITTRTKRPSEVRVYEYDFSLFPEIVGGDTLSGTPTYTVVTGDGELDAGSPSRSGDSCLVSLSNGTDAETYLTEMLCATNSGATLSCVGKVKVSRFGD